MLTRKNSSNIIQVIKLERKFVNLQVKESKYILALKFFFSNEPRTQQNDHTAA